ncbi:ectoine/hydroxyectoine ABC transporter substrate-binding protein EhuB [Pueribacillus theae]|uniref:Ectoine/hydroxyectoine ABC transporter substrate-binding protein EhuB n=1 Tax=Pueribacillus theae TaxID=2171751 RepID=A0A2U1K7A0_9BACI|nr:ectoine/hydroxyectoine ABC transporter substrate-binding protein EhuB [Pueribacillus theae]PWA13262.1 ectoine/hydroxyectoine ABC transporter substrate-binding protein EhuB [Pueribacillus theae]
MKKLFNSAILFALLLVLAACGSSGSSGDGEDSDNLLASLKEKGSVTIGFANEKPYAYEEDGELKGAAVDIAKAVFKEMGIDKVEGQLSDFGQLIPGLNAGKFDVITAGMAITPDRCKNAAFAEPELQYGEGLVVKAGNPENLHSYKDIADHPDIKVAVMAGATENEFLIREGVSKDQIMSVPDIPASFSAVESGRAHATTATEMTIKMALESANNNNLEFVTDFEQPDIEGVPSYGAAAFRKDNEALKNAYNEALAKIKEDGTLIELAEKSGFTEEMNMVPEGITAENVCSGEEY